MMGKLLCLAFLAVFALRADLRFKQVCALENALPGSPLAVISETLRDQASQEQYVTAAKQLIRYGKKSIIRTEGETQAVEIDHESQVWKRDNLSPDRVGTVAESVRNTDAKFINKGIKGRVSVDRDLPEREILGYAARGARLNMEIDMSALFEQMPTNARPRREPITRMVIEIWTTDRIVLPGAAFPARGVAASPDASARQLVAALESAFASFEGGPSALNSFQSSVSGFPLETSISYFPPRSLDAPKGAEVVPARLVIRMLEVSQDPIPDSVFEIPKDYRQIPH